MRCSVHTLDHFRFHDVCHERISSLIKAGWSDTQVMAQSGRRDPKSLKHYTNLRKRHLADALAAIPHADQRNVRFVYTIAVVQRPSAIVSYKNNSANSTVSASPCLSWWRQSARRSAIIGSRCALPIAPEISYAIEPTLPTRALVV